MEKLIINFFIITLLFGCYSDTNSQIDLIKNNIEVENNLKIKSINGNIKSIKELYYFAIEKEGVIIKKDLLSDNIILNIYNKDGYLTEITQYDIDGVFSQKVSLKYNDKRKLIEINQFDSNYNKVVTISYLYKYNENNIEKTKFLMGFFLSTDTLKYNQKGKLIWKISCDKDSILKSISGYKYDENGVMFEESTYNFLNYIFYKYKYKIDIIGNKIEECFFVDSRIEYKITYKYDEHGNILQKKYFYSNGNLKFNKTYIYEFDNKNNWIKKITYKEGILQNIVEREIKYY